MRKLRDSKAYLIMDLQYGSTGKGLLAGKLARELEPDVAVCAWTPNAGHTYKNSDGLELVHRAIPHGAISPRCKAVLLGPNSVLDLRRVMDELAHALSMTHRRISEPVQLVIHPAAVILMQRHRDWEELSLKHNGSTRKGSAAAHIDKIQRPKYAVTIGQYLAEYRGNQLHFTEAAESYAAQTGDRCLVEFVELMTRWTDEHGPVKVRVSAEAYEGWLVNGRRVQIEGAQGYSLSLNGRFFPYCTGRDVTPAQTLADCGVPFGMVRDVFVIGTMRTFPIRVNNREGNSGGCYGDQHETTFEALGVPPELTTVTRLPRRIFTLSLAQTREAVQACDVDAVFLNFCNYLLMRHEHTETERMELQAVIELIEEAGHGRVAWLGWGDLHEDIEEVPHAL